MTNLQTNVPLQSISPIGEDGKMSEPWFYFLVQLWRRTGGNTPIPPSGITLDDVFAVEETYANHFEPSGNFAGHELSFAPPKPVQQVLPDIPTFTVPHARVSDLLFPMPSRDVADETFSNGTDFTAGTSTTITLKESFASSSRLWIFFDGVFQGDEQYSLSGVTITFTSAIPSGTNKVYVKGLR